VSAAEKIDAPWLISDKDTFVKKVYCQYVHGGKNVLGAGREGVEGGREGGSTSLPSLYDNLYGRNIPEQGRCIFSHHNIESNYQSF